MEKWHGLWMIILSYQVLIVKQLSFFMCSSQVLQRKEFNTKGLQEMRFSLIMMKESIFLKCWFWHFNRDWLLLLENLWRPVKIMRSYGQESDIKQVLVVELTDFQIQNSMRLFSRNLLWEKLTWRELNTLRLTLQKRKKSKLKTGNILFENRFIYIMHA